MSDAFSNLHPILNFIFFLAVISVTVLTLHPSVLGLSLLCAFFYAVILYGFGTAIKRLFLFSFPIMLLTALINPLFNHYGVTTFFYLPNGNPVTAESTVYGLMSGLMISAVIMWFFCVSKVMTSDKYICILGAFAPKGALVLSMALKFIPDFELRRKMIRDAGRIVGRRKGDGIRDLSILTTWALESSLDITDSMEARGYGSGRRTSYSAYRLKKRDVSATIYMLVFGAVTTYSACAGAFYASYNPVIKITFTLSEWKQLSGFCAFAAFCLLPVFSYIGEYAALKRVPAENVDGKESLRLWEIS